MLSEEDRRSDRRRMELIIEGSCAAAVKTDMLQREGGEEIALRIDDGQDEDS